MKHEALTDAISMLDDDLVAEAQEPFRKHSAAPVISFCAAAACAAAVFAFVLLPKGSGAEILVMGADPSASPVVVHSERTRDVGISIVSAFAVEYTDIPVSVVSEGKTVVSVSAGELYIMGEETEYAQIPLELNGDASLVWSVPLWDGGEQFEFTAQTGKNCRTLLLSFDEASQEWTITESSEQE